MTMKSISSKIEEKILKIVGAKKIFERPNCLALCKIKNTKKPLPPVGQLSFWKEHSLNNFFYFEHKTKQKKLIIYFHGGAFVTGPIFFHWSYLKKLSKKTGASVVLPIYPKAPNFSFEDCYNFLFDFYQLMTTKFAGCEISFVGDSAGGNIALSFAQQLKQKGVPPPKNIVLFSPCLDLTLSNPEIANLEKDNVDPMLSVKGLKSMYAAWAKNEDLRNPVLSPLWGDFENIGRIMLFVGTDEILYPEAKAFQRLAKEKNIEIDFYEKEKMHHAFPLHPIKEAKEAFKIIQKILKNKRGT